jgi:hypothetical protein
MNKSNGKSSGSPAILRELFESIAADIGDPTALDSLSHIDYQNPAQPLPDWLVDKIDRTRNTVFRNSDFWHRGAFEFQIGLRLLDNGHFQQAISQFESARHQWSFIEAKPLICLAYLAEAVTHIDLRNYDDALKSKLSAERCLDNYHPAHKMSSEKNTEGDISEFLRNFREQLEATGILLEEYLTVEQPFFKQLSESDGMQAETELGLKPAIKLKIEPDSALAATDFRKTVLPCLETLESFNDIVINYVEAEPLPKPTIIAISYNPPLEITLAGVAPITTAMLSDLIKNQTIRIELEQMRSELEGTQVKSELARFMFEQDRTQPVAWQEVDKLAAKIEQLEYEIDTMQLQMAKDLVHSYFEEESNSKRSMEMASSLKPVLEQLLDILSLPGVSIEQI